eukprot:TRINITY_DN90959_c0_g1_i1.p1 TRINITY_DN90959_c0_g1~~TRINITY_DN90959_c0_g1_i1.p1  ORF type:complete len:808 (+),score=214.51 TRINITY_DN90959_c0_g1_i1:146-2569(+)
MATPEESDAPRSPADAPAGGAEEDGGDSKGLSALKRASMKINMAAALGKPKKTSETDRLIDALRTHGGGSVLRGWRRELDSDGDLDVRFQEFCKATEKLNCKGNYQELFEGDGTLAIDELIPQEGGWLSTFRQWLKDAFGGPYQMFHAFDESNEGKIMPDQFVSVALAQGCPLQAGELREVYNCCDVDDGGSITIEEVAYLETDAEVRALEMFKMAKKGKEDHQLLMAHFYTEDLKRNVSQKSRRAQPPWLAEEFERLPSLTCAKRLERQRILFYKTIEAKVIFLHHIRDVFGTEARAWRMGMDVGGNWEVSHAQFKKFCRGLDIPVDIGLLWKALDKDGDEQLRLEKLCVQSADYLGAFSGWAKEHFGSLAAIWDTKETVRWREKPQQKDGRWASGKKMSFNAFAHALQELSCPHMATNAQRSVIGSALDAHSCGFISKDDLEWLDRWDPPEWLMASPDQAAWEEVRKMSQRRYAHPLRAWRYLWDEDNSNLVSWEEFTGACEKLNFQGNIAGAFRHLDRELTGAITMKQYDAASAELLESFKAWADENFGSVTIAFKAIVPDGLGMLSFSELRKSCRKLKWTGDVRLLYDCLNCGASKDASGRSSLSLKDMSWLDCWATSVQDDEKEVEAHLWEQHRPKTKAKPPLTATLKVWLPRCAGSKLPPPTPALLVNKSVSMPKLMNTSTSSMGTAAQGEEENGGSSGTGSPRRSGSRGGTPAAASLVSDRRRLSHEEPSMIDRVSSPPATPGLSGAPFYKLAGGRPKAMKVAKIYHCSSAPKLHGPLSGHAPVRSKPSWLERSLLTVPL